MSVHSATVHAASTHRSSAGIGATRPDVAAALAAIKGQVVAENAAAADDFAQEIERQQHKQVAASKATYVANAPDIGTAVATMLNAQKENDQ